MPFGRAALPACSIVPRAQFMTIASVLHEPCPALLDKKMAGIVLGKKFGGPFFREGKDKEIVVGYCSRCLLTPLWS